MQAPDILNSSYLNATGSGPSLTVPQPPTVTLPTSSITLGVTANGTGPFTYLWIVQDFPAMYTGNTVLSGSAPTMNNLIAGTYYIKLTVSDGNGTSTTNTSFTVLPPQQADTPPVAAIAPVANMEAPASSATLDGSASTGTHLAYFWQAITVPVGSSPVISSPYSSSTNVSGLVTGQYVFQLLVSNGAGNDNKKVSFSITQQAVPPVPSAGADQSVTLPNSQAMLDGSASAGANALSYAWAMVSGPGPASITGATQAKATISGLVQGSYVYQLTVTDTATGASATAATTVTVNAPDTSTAPVTVPADTVPTTATADATTTATAASVPLSSPAIPALIIPLNPYGSMPGGGGGGDNGAADPAATARKFLWVIAAVVALGFLVYKKGTPPVGGVPTGGGI